MGLKAVQEVAVAATKSLIITLAGIVVGIVICSTAYGAILPEERADVLYHSYEGGGVKIDGPSVLVRKNVKDKYSFQANYYVDMVTSASIDVLATASEYTEERTEYSVGMDYLNDRTIMSVSYTNSTESDYIADTLGFTINQEFFGDLSTLTLGFTLGDDTVKATGQPDFEEALKRKRYSLGFSQILTKQLITSFSYETVIDEGFLRNPYRRARRVDNNDEDLVNDFIFISPAENQLLCESAGSEVGGECYPETRNSEAFAIRSIYAINNRASIRGEYRIFADSWGVESNNVEIRYTQKLGSRWLIELRARQYRQSKGADFYQDNFDFSAITEEFYARDKELSQYSAQQFGIGISYTFKSRYHFFNNSSLNLHWDVMTFDYDDFRDANDGTQAETQNLYSLDADVIRLYYSAFF